MPNIRAMPNVLGSMVEVGVLAFDVREGMMTDHMLMNPGIRSTEHEADVHPVLVNFPVFREREVACVMVNIDGPNPECYRESEECIPVPINVGLDLSHGNRE